MGRWSISLSALAVLALAYACTDDEPAGCIAGTEACECIEGGQCVNGLTCASNVCVDLQSADSGGAEVDDAADGNDSADADGADGGADSDGSDGGLPQYPEPQEYAAAINHQTGTCGIAFGSYSAQLEAEVMASAGCTAESGCSVQIGSVLANAVVGATTVTDVEWKWALAASVQCEFDEAKALADCEEFSGELPPCVVACSASLPGCD